MSVNFDFEAKLLATGDVNGSINIYNLNYGELETRIDIEEVNIDNGFIPARPSVTWLKWKPNFGGSRLQSNILAASYGNNTIKIWDTTHSKGPSKVITEEGNTWVYSIDYSTSGTHLVSGGTDATLRIYDMNNLKLVQKFEPKCLNKVDHFNRIHCVKFNTEDDRLIYSGGADQQVWIHDTRVRDPIEIIVGPSIIGDSIDIQNFYLLTGSYRSKEWIEVWDLRTYERVSAFQWEKDSPRKGGQVVAAKFLKGSTKEIIAAGRAQKDVKIFDQTNGDIVGSIDKFEEMNYSLDLNYEGNMISIGNKNGSVYLFEYE